MSQNTLAWVCVALLVAACGGSETKVVGPRAAADGAGDGGAAGAEAGPEAAAKPVERAFAATAIEAQSMIQQQIDSRMKVLWRCVDDYRSKKGDPHRAVSVDVGIDQEGTLLGVTSTNPKQELDPTLQSCLMTALRGLAFPRSHAGVISVRQSFKDASIVP
jgi:hypothetical protein